MTNRDVAALAARILALVTLVIYLHVIIASSAALLLGAWEVVFDTGRVFPNLRDYSLGLGFVAVPGGAYLVAAWFLWSRAEWIAAKLVPDSVKSDAWPSLQRNDLQVAAFSVVGLLALLSAVRHLAGSIAYVLRHTYSFVEWATLPETLSAVASLAIGVTLLLGSPGILRFIYFLRTAGRRPSPGDDTFDAGDERETAAGSTP